MFGSFASTRMNVSSEDYALASSLCRIPSNNSTMSQLKQKIKKQMESSGKICEENSLSSLVVHAIDSSMERDEFNFPFTRYKLLLENPRTGRIWEIHRRYSTIEQFRRRLLQAIETPHCHYCSELADRIRAIQFPHRKLWGSLHPSVVSKRMQMFHAFLQELIKLVSNPYFSMCNKVRLTIRMMIHTFVTYEAKVYHCLLPQKENVYQVPSLLDIKTNLRTIFEAEQQ